jgi:hypothetical protein
MGDWTPFHRTLCFEIEIQILKVVNILQVL